MEIRTLSGEIMNWKNSFSEFSILKWKNCWCLFSFREKREFVFLLHFTKTSNQTKNQKQFVTSVKTPRLTPPPTQTTQTTQQTQQHNCLPDYVRSQQPWWTCRKPLHMTHPASLGLTASFESESRVEKRWRRWNIIKRVKRETEKPKSGSGSSGGRAGRRKKMWERSKAGRWISENLICGVRRDIIISTLLLTYENLMSSNQKFLLTSVVSLSQPEMHFFFCGATEFH